MTAVAEAVATVAELVPDPDSWEAGNRQAIAARYRVVRPFVRLLAEELPLGAAPAGTELLVEIRAGFPGCCAGGWVRSR
ncbi:hypothetical protein F6X68_05140 [Micromonospora sp. AMSO12t]|uniref:hypothetical protein n=1 Tax=Micromonospora sp. AMSO12t TaxID=2650410 RepID=UPI00124B00EF|nr:hypothetical protein [Micromonospora sp. AMSO12t]KAB1161308.1 hypothetical protein F6X68_05140 [Micromonospora sp. AMSO12t]